DGRPAVAEGPEGRGGLAAADPDEDEPEAAEEEQDPGPGPHQREERRGDADRDEHDPHEEGDRREDGADHEGDVVGVADAAFERGGERARGRRWRLAGALPGRLREGAAAALAADLE